MSEKFQNKYRISSSRLKNWDYGQNSAYFITICTENREHFFGEIMSVNGKNEMQLNEKGKLADAFWAEIPKHFPFVELGNYVVMPNHVHGILIVNKTNVVDDVVETLHCNVSVTDDDKTLHRNASVTDDDKTLHRNISVTGDDKTLHRNASVTGDDKTLHRNVSVTNDDKTLHRNISVTNDDKTLHRNISVTDDDKTLQCNVSTRNGTKNEHMMKISPKPGTISTIIRSFKSVVTRNVHFIHADFGWQERFHDHIIRNSESFQRIQNYIENNVENWKEDKFYN